MFFAKRNVDALKKYKYRSLDNSFLTIHPSLSYWNYLGKFIPSSISPNAITISGFLVILAQTVAVIYADSRYEGKSKLLTALSSVAMFIYVTCDALDGVQARAIKAGSSLGQLFDHGVDSVVTTLIILCMASGIGIECKKSVVVMLISSQTIFYWTTLREYYTGTFYLGILGPTEVIILSCILLLCISLFGKKNVFFFKRKYPNLLRRFVFIGSIIIWYIGTAYYVWSIYTDTKFGINSGRTTRDIAYNISSHVIFLLTQGVMLWIALNEKRVTSMQLLFFLGICTMAFSLFTTLAIYSHQLSSPQIEYPIILPLLVLIAGIVVWIAPSKFIGMGLYILFGLGVILYAFSVKNIIQESLEALQIPFFNKGQGMPKLE